jgi:hypothetical protein
MAFTKKLLTYTISLVSGGGQAANLSGLRSSCRIIAASGPSMGHASVAIFGMTLSQMNQYSTIGRQFNYVNKNTLTIMAGDTNGQSLIFTGTIISAYVEASAMPEVAFRIEAVAGGFESVIPSMVTSVQGAADVATTMGQIAMAMGLQFENNGVMAKVQNPYLSGSYREQAKELADQAGIQWVIEKGILAIWPTGMSRSGGGTAFSPQTGMVGYPAFDQANVIITSIFVPNLIIGGMFTVKSSLTPANGSWIIIRIDYDLESITPYGRWFVIVQGCLPGMQPPGEQQ